MKKTKRFVVLFLIVSVMMGLEPLEARQGFSLGMGPIGNIYLIDSIPIMDPGVGGSMSFQYRFHEQVAFETTFFLSAQDGRNTPGGALNDTGILFLGMPVFDLKYFLLTDPEHWDPFLGIGLGLYWLTEGSLSNSTGGVGLGTQVVTGFDYYLTDVISLGFQGVFRSIPIITSVNNSTAIFPYSLMGNVAFHF